MKVILSRKGFDQASGGMPNPIMPDGTLLSMPIPSPHDNVAYKDLQYKGMPYPQLIRQLKPKFRKRNCHLDPDVRKGIRKYPIKGWKPAFGPSGAAHTYLQNTGVKEGDLFLFFGWFRKVELHDGAYRFVRKGEGSFFDHSDLHVIFAYMQIGKILEGYEKTSKYWWHPHVHGCQEGDENVVLYTPTKKLSFLPDYSGYGTLDYRQDRVLTMEGQTRAVWNKLPFLTPKHVYGNRKNSAGNKGLFYDGQWQELVVCESEDLLKWAKEIIQV